MKNLSLISVMLLTIFIIYSLLALAGHMFGIALLQNFYFNVFTASFVVAAVKTYSITESSVNSLIRQLSLQELSCKALQQITVMGNEIKHNFKTKLNITLPEKINYYVINDSALNASALGKNHIIFTSGLLKDANISELRGILAHEFGHFAYSDSVNSQAYYGVANVTIHLTNFFRKAFALIMTIISGLGLLGMILFIIILPVTLTIIALIATGLLGCRLIRFFRMFFERTEEFRADMTACKAGYAEEFYKGMEKIAECDTSPESMFVTMFKTHPSTHARLKRTDIYAGGERIKNKILGRYAHNN